MTTATQTGTTFFATSPVCESVAEIAPDQLSALEIGDVISTDVSVDGEVTVRLAGIPKYIGQLSTVDGKKAITITRKITDQD